MKIAKKDDSKMKELILHVAKLSENDPKFGAIKLNKILFYADFLAYFKRDKSITGQEYFALEEGPAPKRLLPIRQEMESAGELAIKKVDCFGLPNPQTRVVALREPDYNKLSSAELADVDAVIQKLRVKTGREVSDDSHKFLGWRSAFRKGPKTTIPYSTVLFDPEGFLGLEMPQLPESIVEHGRKLDQRLKSAARLC